MKKILLIVALLAVALSSNAFAVQRTATFGDKNSSGVYRMTATNDGVITYAADTGIVVPYLIPATTNTTLTAAQSGRIVTFNGGAGVAVNGTVYTLPAATVGLNYAIIADVAKTWRVAVNGTDSFLFSTAVAGSHLGDTSGAIGDSISVVCLRAGFWSILDKTGTWVVDNNPT